MKPGKVTFAGAGPGAVDLLTIRCRDAIAEAEIIVYAGSLVNPEVLQYAKEDADLHDSAALTLEDTTALLVDGCRKNLKVLRLHTGDPSMYGAIAEQIAKLEEAGVEFEVIPGVSSVFAAAASVGRELTLPGSSQTVILTRRAGRTPVPEKQDIHSLASHNATMGIFLSVSDMPGLVEELLSGGYSESTPVSVVYRASWPDEQSVTGTLSDIADKVKDAGISRQALVLVGDALSGHGERSLLYDPHFAHGYRASDSEPKVETPDAPLKSAPFLGRVAVYGLTAKGCDKAREIAGTVGGDTFVSQKHAAESDQLTFDPHRLDELLKAQWQNYDAHVLVMAMGIAVRKTSALLKDKTKDPAIVVCDEGGSFAISTAGGHIGGANRLAQQIGSQTGATPVITTATDVQGVPAFDEIASRQGWSVVNRDAIKTINHALLQKLQIGFIGPQSIVEKYYLNHNFVRSVETGSIPDDINVIVALDSDEIQTDLPVLYFRSLPLVAGIGCRKGTPADEIKSALDSVLEQYALESKRVESIASAEAKKDDPGLSEFADQSKLPMTFYSSDELKEVPVPTPSAMPEKHIGTPSVAEAASLLQSGGRLLVPKEICGNVTIAIAAKVEDVEKSSEPASGHIYAVGIGPGDVSTITPQARDAMDDSDIIVGYKTYIQQVEPIIAGKELLSSGMRQEIDRCQAAIEEAMSGKRVSVICSGDAGVYGMAGLLLELLAEKDDPVDITVVPGITAALTAAASLGAPLMNDFAIISLSDLLTERDLIIKRLHSVASSGMPCALYNPRSKKRHDLFNQALEIFSAAVSPELPCGMVRNAGRKDEEIWVGTIASLPVEQVDMFTVVIIGGTATEIINGKLVTRRGYESKRR